MVTQEAIADRTSDFPGKNGEMQGFRESVDTPNEIVILDLVKQFDDVTAVNGLNLEIRKGEICGLLGPNGA